MTEHFLKNAHRYWNIGEEEARKIKIEAENEVGKKSDDAQSVTVSNECIEVNKALKTIQALKKQNRIWEQQDLVVKLRAGVGSYQDISKCSGTALKTVHEWCSTPKDRIHKLTSKANLCKEEFINFLMQDTIMFSCSSKRFAGKRFMVDTLAEIYKKYLEQPQFHTQGIISKSTLWNCKPKFVKLSGSTPVLQCLCDYCKNCELMMRALVAAGVKGVPSTKYLAIDATLCDASNRQFSTEYKFKQQECILCNCQHCGKVRLKIHLDELNTRVVKPE